MVLSAERYRKHRVDVEGLEMGSASTRARASPWSSRQSRPTCGGTSSRTSPTWTLHRPDPIGMGDSAKLAVSGRHRTRSWNTAGISTACCNEPSALNSEVTLVVHDWGSALASIGPIATARPLPARLGMEAIVRPLPPWNEWPDAGASIFRGLSRSPAGEEMVLDQNLFVEEVLPTEVMRCPLGQPPTASLPGASASRAGRR